MTNPRVAAATPTFGETERRALAELLQRCLGEDAATRDVTTATLRAACADLPLLMGRILCRQPGVVAGLTLLPEALTLGAPEHDLSGHYVKCFHQDGDLVRPGDLLACVTGCPELLHARERLVMNLVGHLSGIATMTRAFVDAVAGSGVRILHTRKTTPGLRDLELYAVRCGGGEQHRADLASAILLKENHFSSVPGQDYATVLQRVVEARRPDRLIVAEATSLKDALIATGAGVEVVMLDNFETDELPRAVSRVKEAPRPAGAQPVEVEVSGGVTLDNVREIAAAGPDRISIGALTHSSPRLDLTFLVHAIATRHLRPPPQPA
jgi:nicotinate-nucleotide pyrophosphorylase (carboxylating)